MTQTTAKAKQDPRQGRDTMTSQLEAILLDIATKANMTPVQALALPTAIEVAARKSAVSKLWFARQCQANEALRNYVAQVCCEAIAS
jgi:hypothetical protein